MKQTTWWQPLLPQHVLSMIAGKLASVESPWFKNWAIKTFMQRYGISLTEAQIENYQAFKTFGDFFTRHLKPGARPLPQSGQAIVSPVDGMVSEVGQLQRDAILQAKGKYYSVASLLGDPTLANTFNAGSFFTAYLAPRDYHRFHMPFAGKLREMRYYPGNLFSVNEASVAAIDRLFARNERVVAVFETEIGPMAYVAVGAMIVGSINMAWHGVVNETHPKHPKRWTYQDQAIELARGQECGYFQLGSTVILLFPSDTIEWASSLKTGTALKMGQAIATIKGSKT